MPVLSAKTQSSGFEALAAKVEAKKQEKREKAIANEVLKSFSVKSLEKEKSTTDADADASTQNFTVKRNISKDTDLNINISVKSTIDDRQKQVQTEAINKEASKNERTGRSSSIISGSQKLQELQDLKKQLNKNYQPKPLFEPRRPTMESIKSAIEKAKLDEANRNKNVGTDGLYIPESRVVITSDVATSIEKALLMKKKKVVKKKKPTPDSVSASSAGTSSPVNSAVVPTKPAEQKIIVRPKKFVLPKTRIKKYHAKAKVDSNLRPPITPSSSSDDEYGNPNWPDD